MRRTRLWQVRLVITKKVNRLVGREWSQAVGIKIGYENNDGILHMDKVIGKSHSLTKRYEVLILCTVGSAAYSYSKFGDLLVINS